jgi:hypothetical protein
MLRTAQVGLHVFYRFNPHALRSAPAGDDDGVVLASAPASANPPLRLAEAVMAPIAAAPPPAAAKSAPRLSDLSPVSLAPVGLAKTDAAAPPKASAATPS